MTVSINFQHNTVYKVGTGVMCRSQRCMSIVGVSDYQHRIRSCDIVEFAFISVLGVELPVCTNRDKGYLLVAHYATYPAQLVECWPDFFQRIGAKEIVGALDAVQCS